MTAVKDFPIKFLETRFDGGSGEPARREAVLRSLKFSRFVDRLRGMDGVDGISVTGVVVHKVFFFGSNVGYVMAEGIATNADGSKIAGLSLVRGVSVAIMPVLRTPDGGEHTILVHQRRLPMGEADFEEIPAGMIDEGVFRSKALDELREEIGADLDFAEDDLVPLETFAPSPGGCDETVTVFLAEKEVSSDFLKKLSGRLTGNREDGELLRLEVIPLDALSSRALADGKTRIAYYSYMAMRGRVASPGIPTPGAAGPRRP